MSAPTMRVETAAPPAPAGRLTAAEALDLARSIWFYAILAIGFGVPVLMPLYALLTR